MKPTATILSIVVAIPTLLSAQSRNVSTADRFDRAYYQWDAGRYDSALVNLRAVLTSAEADALHDCVAELTGEIWQTRLVAENASAPQWSPDGSRVSYEVRSGQARTLFVRRLNVLDGTPELEVAGWGLSFSPDGQTYAFQNTRQGRPTLGLAHNAGRVVDFMPMDAAAITDVTLFGRPTRLALLAGTPGDTSAKLLVRDVQGGDGSWHEVTVTGGHPVSLLRSPDGSRLLVQLGARGAFARQLPGFAATSRVTGFAELTGNALGPVITGVSPVWSASGNALAWVEPTEGGARIRVIRGMSEPSTAATIDGRFLPPSLSPDGRSVTFAMMPREDWELFVAPADGSTPPRQLTREIQHDLFPQYLSENRLLAVMGEGRHRRSFLYDLRSGERTRLFHNNSVRTVAPEYEWAVSPDGQRVLIVSERDGDTVTPHRHLYLMDLTAKVSREALIARVDSNLAAERALRARGRQMFAPIAAEVQAAVREVNTGRIYDYQRALFQFDSKHITQPGNWAATEWLLDRYRRFGLESRLQRFTTLQGRELEVANVIATIPGTVHPELVYVIGAHFDSRAEGPGADDNTSGTAMILEAARVLATRPQPATLMFVAFTGEESGLRGAREFGRRMKDSIHVVGALNNDMMGWSNDHRLDNTIRYSNPGIRDVQHAAAIQFSDLITYDAFYYKNTDAHALYDAWGDIVGGIGSHPILGNPHYHQPHDVLETINHRQLAETSKTTVATIMLLANSPSRLTGLTAAGKTATWERAPEKDVRAYIVRYGPPETPTRFSARVTNPRITLNSLQPGWHIAVKAVNAKGMEGWDWARAVVQ